VYREERCTDVGISAIPLSHIDSRVALLGFNNLGLENVPTIRCLGNVPGRRLAIITFVDD
jgi:hypothetical protein